MPTYVLQLPGKARTRQTGRSITTTVGILVEALGQSHEGCSPSPVAITASIFGRGSHATRIMVILFCAVRMFDCTGGGLRALITSSCQSYPNVVDPSIHTARTRGPCS
jgi:hypothetical protein